MKNIKEKINRLAAILLLAGTVLSSCARSGSGGGDKTSTDTQKPETTVTDTTAKDETTPSQTTSEIITTVPLDTTEIKETTTPDATSEAPAHQHTLTSHSGKAPTCIDGGWADYETCSTCDHSTYRELSPLKHDYSENKDVCSRCGVYNMPAIYITEYEGTAIPVKNLQKYNGEIFVKYRFDSNGRSYPDFECAAIIKVQGSSSTAYPKKNFTVKLYNDTTFEKKHKVDLGWGKESKYCMKANYVDASHGRNIVGARMFTELVASRSYINPGLQSAPNYGLIDGFPVAVYLNGEFYGLYTMNIPKDNWQFGMDKDYEGNQAILMANTWTDSVRLREEIGDSLEDSGWELEYASTEDTDTTWVKDSFNELIRLVNCGDKEKIKNELASHVDIEAAIDTFLFIYFLDGADNSAKNILWATYDGRIWIPSMYDMDATFGMYWTGAPTPDDKHITLSLKADGTPNEPTCKLFAVLLECYADEVKARWNCLREEILTVENTTAHFEAFFADIPKVVFDAEAAKWPDIPNIEVNKTNMFAATEAQLQRLDAFFAEFNIKA